MASVAVPLIASFVVNKVGESQGWDPRMTAVLGAVAGFGAGSFVSAGASVAASSAASSAANSGLASTATTGGMASGATAMGRGALGTQLAAQGARTAGGAAWGYGAGANAAAGARAAAGSANAIAAASPSASGGLYQNWMPGDDGIAFINTTTVPNTTPTIPSKLMSIKAQYPGVNVMDSGSMYANAPVGLHKPITMGEAMGNEIDAWTKDPVDPKTGEPTGKLSAAKNFGVSALKTLMKPLPEKAPIRSGGGGGGPQAPAYQGGGQSAPYQTVWSFGQPNQGYKPQGI